MSRLRLLKVVVQPVFAIDDGETLTETTAEPVVVASADWPTYPATRFLEAVNELQSELDTGAKPPRSPTADAAAGSKT
jgi:hypothetical protein